MNYLTTQFGGKKRGPTITIGAIILIILIGYLAYDVVYAGRVLAKVRLGQVDLGNQLMAEARASVMTILDETSQQRMTLIMNGSSVSYTLDDWGVVFDRSATFKAVRNFGRSYNPFLNLVQRVESLFATVQVPAVYNLAGNFDQIVSQLEIKINQEPKPAQVVITGPQANPQPSVVGQKLNQQLFESLLSSRLAKLDFSPLKLPVVAYAPPLNTELAEITASKINQQLSQPYVLAFGDQTFELASDELWRGLKVTTDNDRFVVRLDKHRLASYFQKLERQVNQPMQNAVFKMEKDTVVAFKPDQPGSVLRVKDAVRLIQSTLLTPQRDLELPVNYLEPKVTLASLNHLGIDELVAQGLSNFVGSPANRRHNIRVGAERFNLVLIPPQNTFSFNQALGQVDASTGYLPELVIKGDKTIPEYGGGLCQVSTTAFRAILGGGYPVTERKNHSYRVAYYEPAGSDATIYPPWPDLKFTNDSPGYILMHAYIDGNNLHFDFYGTAMNRRVELEGPYIYNVTDYPDPVYIETSTIPEGEVKQVDSAHRGADAILYRYIYNENDQEVRKDIFRSHYIPWPAKYLVGVKEAPQIEADLGNVLPESSASEASLIELTQDDEP